MKCIIIEDELPAQNIIKAFLKKIPDVELLATFQTAVEANEFFKSQTADVVFLDINLPDIFGIDFIKTLKNPPKIIMTTAYPDYAVESFELETIVDYLVKPFSFDRFLKAIKKTENHFKKINSDEKKAVFLNVDKTLYKVHLNEILYLVSDRNYTTIVTQHKKYVLIEALKNWAITLPENFIQVHKSYIVNMHKVEKLSGNLVYINDTKIPIGRTFKAAFLQKINYRNKPL